MWPFSPKTYLTLAKAVHCGDLRAVRLMLQSGEDANSYDPEYEAYALHFAIGRLSWETANYAESVEIVKILVEHGANVNIPLKGRMPLWVAEAGRHTEVVALLRKAGARLRSDEDNLSLHPAKEREIRKVVRDYIHQVERICPTDTKEQLAEMIERRIVIRPDTQALPSDYERFREEIRSIIRDEVGL
jgi:ankyrin repeat protein